MQDKRIGIGAIAGAALITGLAAPGAGAETSQVSPGGFTVTHAMAVEAEPERVFRAFTEMPRWWNPAHTSSGSAANLTLDAQAGGCWCERWGDGASAMHGRVLMVQPGAGLRLHAWLGPLQQMPVTAVLSLGTARQDGVTRLRVSYRVAGSPEDGLNKLAAAVDGVLAEQVRRLKAYVETGAPR